MAKYDIDIRDYWRIVKKRKAIIIFSMVTLSIFAFIFGNYRMRKVVFLYSSSAMLRIGQQEGGQGQAMALWGFSENDDVATEVKSINSFDVLAEIAAQMRWIPDSLVTMAPEERNRIIQTDPYLLSVIEDLNGRITPQRDEYTNIIHISAFDTDPLVARDLAQTAAVTYKNVKKRRSSEQTQQAIEFIQSRILEIEAKKDSNQVAIKQASAMFDDQLPYYSRENISRDMSEMNRRNTNLSIKMNSTKMMIDLLEKDGTIDETVLSNTFVEQEGGLFRNQFLAYREELDRRRELLEYLTPDNPQVKALTEKIEADKKQLVVQLSQNLKAHEVTQASYDVEFRALTTRYENILSKDEALERLMDRQRVLNANYLEFTNQLVSFQVKDSENVDTISIIKPAVVNPVPINSSTSVASITFIGLFLGTVIGLTAALVFETFDTSIGTIEDVETFLGVPVVGLIPFVGMDSLKSMKDPNRAKKHNTEDMPQDHAMLVIYYAPKSVLAESYRSMRTNIQFIQYEKEAKVLLFTSSTAGEGKTTTIVNLALTMAQTGNRVLLFDADLRRPSIDGLFGLDREEGLTEILLGKRHWRECVKTVADIITGKLGLTDLILQPGIDNLHIITCGAIPPNPSELLDSENMDIVISEVRNEYDIVLFDCSPTLPATDSAVLGRKVDGLVLVYAVGKVSRGSLKRAKNQLDNVKASVIGAVLNGIRSEISADFQDYKYKEYSYTYEADGEEEGGGIDKFKRLVGGILNRFS